MFTPVKSKIFFFLSFPKQKHLPPIDRFNRQSDKGQRVNTSCSIEAISNFKDFSCYLLLIKKHRLN